VDRVIVLGRLKVGTRERAEQLIADEAAADGPEDRFDRVTIFLSDTEVVFLLEGANADESFRAILNDPVRSTRIAPWLPLFDCPLHAMREASSSVS
jgi:hypothetical protein